ncbi:TniQ family protein [Streptomyces sp. WM6373]|uniref:TniQ family protein n=1 Tax=Streptomyces sp. WM6373 TaxID=1415556 RepID=UPI00131A6649|nr:TniQ family protein [Streptomyces sp. WM6373]
MAPMEWETTTSYVQRLARRHHLSTAELLHGLGIPRPFVSAECTQPHGPYTGIELYFNVPGRSLIAAFAGIPDEHLAYALPEWNRYRDKPGPQSARARLRLASAHAVTGCPRCTLARTGDTHPVAQYLPDTRLVCPRHHTWILGRHTLAGTPLPVEHAGLARTPEILAAHHMHVRLLRRRGAAAEAALSLAMDLTENWRRAAPPEERIWPARARRIGDNKRVRFWYALAREAITYPETIALAQFFACHAHMLHIRERPGRVHPLHTSVAALLGRRWLEDPVLYPERFSNRLRHTTGRSPYPRGRWPRRHNPYDPGPTELTELGYQPPRPRKTERATPDSRRSKTPLTVSSRDHLRGTMFD